MPKKGTFFKDKVIIVTGASSGIGKSLALRFSHHGARVVLASRNATKLAELAKDLRAARVLALTATATPNVLDDIC